MRRQGDHLVVTRKVSPLMIHHRRAILFWRQAIVLFQISMEIQQVTVSKTSFSNYVSTPFHLIDRVNGVEVLYQLGS